MSGGLFGYVRRLLSGFSHRVRRDAPRVLWTGDSTFGECPLWHQGLERLFWLDIPSGTLRSYDVRLHNVDSWLVGRQSAGLTINLHDGLLIVGRGTTLRRFDPATGALVDMDVLPDGHAEERVNDLAMDPHNNLWVASMHTAGERPLGRLLRRSPRGEWTVMRSGMPVTNGPAFDARLGVGYVCDTVARRVLRFVIPESTRDAPIETELFISLGPDAGYPDGITVDSESCLWLAHYGGSKVSRWSVDGVLLSVIDMPVENPTSVAIGNQTLFITSAGGGSGKRDAKRASLFGTVIDAV